jgi:hypothetical protein
MLSDTITVYDRHGEQFTIANVDMAMLWVRDGRLFREPPAQPMPHWKEGTPGYMWTEVSADGQSLTEYYSIYPPEHGFQL